MAAASSLRWLSLALALVASGCGASVRARVEHPPLMPARMYASIVVLHRGAPHELEFAEAIAAHLSETSDLRASVMTETQIAQLPGGLPPGSVVLQMRIDSSQSMRMSYPSNYGPSCGFYSCTSNSTMPVAIVTVMTRLTVMLRDGATASILVTRASDEEGDASHGSTILTHLYEQLVSWVDGRREWVRVSVHAPRDVEARAAIAHLEAQRFAEARQSLEAMVARPDFTTRGSRARAQLLLALAFARRFDPTFANDVETRFASARDACDATLRIRDDHASRLFCGRLAADELDARTLLALSVEAERMRMLARAPSSIDGSAQATSVGSSAGAAGDSGAPLVRTALPSPAPAIPVPDPSYSAAAP